MMRLAGMTEFAIAQFLEVTSAHINHILHRPDVASYMMKIDATFVNDLRPTAERVNAKLEASSIRAQEVIEEIMEQMHSRDDHKAKSIALMSARDILDRAGHRPAMKIESKIAHGVMIDPEQLEHALEVIKESR
jgi:flagellar biosynthesis regulator FlaF